MDFDIHDRTPETKAGIPSSDAQDVYDAMMRTFEEFKSENDAPRKPPTARASTRPRSTTTCGAARPRACARSR